MFLSFVSIEVFCTYSSWVQGFIYTLDVTEFKQEINIPAFIQDDPGIHPKEAGLD